jgi:GT2 family glycosyltransferase
MNKISLIIPTVTKTQKYTDNIINNIREIYPNESEVEIIVEINDNVSLGANYNNAVSKSTGDKIILLHNDIVIKPGFIETMDKHIVKNRITTYTRIEPPIYNDLYPGKVILDCGYDLDTFNKNKFKEYSINNEELIDGGSQLFFGCYKEDYFKLDEFTFNPPQMWSSDDDLHLRYKLAGFEHKVSPAHVYHFVSKTSRATNDYQQIELHSNRNFIRKWGFRNSTYNKKYDTGFIIKNCNQQLLEALEPWCSTIYVGCDYKEYIKQEQPNTKFDLSERIKPYDNEKQNYILVDFDARNFTQNSFNIIQNLADIISESGEIGEFELDCFKITIMNLTSFEEDLIKI